MPNYINANEPGLFDLEERLEELHALGDPLRRLDDVMDWAVFEPVLTQLPKAEPKGPGGRPGFRPLMMFKVLVIAHLGTSKNPWFERWAFLRGRSGSAGRS